MWLKSSLKIVIVFHLEYSTNSLIVLNVCLQHILHIIIRAVQLLVWDMFLVYSKNQTVCLTSFPLLPLTYSKIYDI